VINTALLFEVRGGKIAALHAVRNPDKLRHLQGMALQAL
jgi:hypothetical protein